MTTKGTTKFGRREGAPFVGGPFIWERKKTKRVARKGSQGGTRLKNRKGS